MLTTKYCFGYSMLQSAYKAKHCVKFATYNEWYFYSTLSSILDTTSMCWLLEFLYSFMNLLYPLHVHAIEHMVLIKIQFLSTGMIMKQWCINFGWVSKFHYWKAFSTNMNSRPWGARNIRLVLAVSLGNLVFGQRVIGLLVRAIFRDQDGRYSFSDGCLRGVW